MPLRVKTKGDFSNTTKYLKKNGRGRWSQKMFEQLQEFGERGVEALREATPVLTGLTANSWYYNIVRGDGIVKIEFLNSNVKKGYANIALLLQYGHATGNGGWVEGRDYINPAIQPIFDEMINSLWKEVTKV